MEGLLPELAHTRTVKYHRAEQERGPGPHRVRSSPRTRGNCCGSHPALPGGTHDMKAAREHRIVETCTTLDLDVLADKGYVGAGGTVIAPVKRRPNTELPEKHKKPNTVHAALRAPVERAISRITQWRIFRHARTSPNKLTSVAAAILTLMIYT
ncbi:transposase family protein [Streptomyces sp. NPDC001817]|uniref:transposase family protein n=1 Tax=Streptomyces sp. NPDC001817 TaxID=3154398 RepID=UPI00331E6940